MLRHLPLCDYVTSYVSISVDGYLDYWGFGATINTATLNILVQVFGGYNNAFSLGTVVKLPGHRVYIH